TGPAGRLDGPVTDAARRGAGRRRGSKAAAIPALRRARPSLKVRLSVVAAIRAAAMAGSLARRAGKAVRALMPDLAMGNGRTNEVEEGDFRKLNASLCQCTQSSHCSITSS
ncbi:hypothetical protein AB4156_39620, partial [Cupriavidus sp. 2MCAB6]|uniref:hypothetical protein n=1 Tax=Cupriavidus sp. 2MCAB6 TaxID=3232981 RepID=UPI003F8F87C4